MSEIIDIGWKHHIAIPGVIVRDESREVTAWLRNQGLIPDDVIAEREPETDPVLFGGGHFESVIWRYQDSQPAAFLSYINDDGVMRWVSLDTDDQHLASLFKLFFHG